MEKKKSKKQFQAPEENGYADDLDVEQVDLHSKKKKKKKNKEKKENYEEINNSEVEESLPKKKKIKREQQDLEESPRKKKKSSKEDENSILQTSAQNINSLEGTPRSIKTKKEKIEMETEESIIDDEWWSPEDRKAMLEAMKGQITVTGRFSRKGYLHSLRNTNWEDVMCVVNGRTNGQFINKEQCQDQFHILLNKVGTIKSLNQIIDEALTIVSEPSFQKREVVQARHRFIKDYMKRNKGGEDCTLMIGTRLWTNLPAEEKEKWEDEYQNELLQKGLLHSKSKPKKLEGPQNCQYPWECFQDARSAKGEVLISADAKTKYASMSLKKRIPFIVESLKQQKVYEAEAEKYLENNPMYKKTKAHGPLVKEIKDYLESLGMPLNPPTTVFGMFYAEEKEKFTEDNENDSEKVRSVNESLKPFSRAREALSKLPQVQQDRYKSEWRKSWTEYVSEVEKWKPMIAEKYPEILDHALAALAEVKAPKIVNETNSVRTVRKKAADPFPNIERRTSSLTDVKFTDEPPLPARTAYELFQQKYKRDAGANYNATKAKEFWGRMNDEKKAVYTERVSVLKERSKNNFLMFARNLEKQQRKLFVGTRRAKVLKYFQEDIFADEYPGSSYPILIATPRKGSTAQEMDNSEDDFQPSKSSASMKGGIKALAAKMKNDTIKEESSDDEDENEDKNEEEEEEEEEEEDEEEAKEEKESSSSDSESSDDSESESNSEVSASQPTPVSPFSLAKRVKNSSSVSNVANSSPFSGKQQSKEVSSDSGSDSDEESDSDDNKENYETPVSSKAQSKTIQRSGGATSTPAIKENSSDSESSSPSSSDSEDDITPAWKNTSVAATPNSKSAGSAVKEESSDESSEEESEESD